MKTESQFSDFLAGYVDALFWSSTDDVEGETVNLDGYQTSTQADDKCLADCRAFFEANYSHLALAAEVDGYGWGRAGHDFALTRNGHGAGYWDGDLPDHISEPLTAAAHDAGECWPYIGDDGQAYIT